MTKVTCRSLTSLGHRLRALSLMAGVFPQWATLRMVIGRGCLAAGFGMLVKL